MYIIQVDPNLTRLKVEQIFPTRDHLVCNASQVMQIKCDQWFASFGGPRTSQLSPDKAQHEHEATLSIDIVEL